METLWGQLVGFLTTPVWPAVGVVCVGGQMAAYSPVISYLVWKGLSGLLRVERLLSYSPFIWVLTCSSWPCYSISGG